MSVQTSKSMCREWVVYALITVWVALVALGFVGHSLAESSGSGFTRGMNRAAIFFKWQAFALLLAFAIWRAARHVPGRKWPGYVPILLSGGFFLAIILFYVGRCSSHSAGFARLSVC